MSTQQASVEPGKKRATELVDAFRTNTNDALLFVARYGNQAKNEMSTAEYKEFMSVVQSTGKMEMENDVQGLADARVKINAMLAPYPALLRDFDKFDAAATVAEAVFGKHAARKSK